MCAAPKVRIPSSNRETVEYRGGGGFVRAAKKEAETKEAIERERKSTNMVQCSPV